MTCGIYKITCKVNHKVYIGQSKNVKKRLTSHKTRLKHNKHPNEHLQRAFNLYGIKNFKFEIISKCQENEIDDLERIWIALYDSTDSQKGYNIEWGGNPRKGECSEETRKKLSEAIKGEKNYWYGKNLSYEHKEKLRLSHIGKNTVDKQKLEYGLYLYLMNNRQTAIYKICKQVHVTYKLLKTYITEKGLYLSKEDILQNKLREAINLYISGKSMIRIERELHLDHIRFSKELHRLGLFDSSRVYRQYGGMQNDPKAA